MNNKDMLKKRFGKNLYNLMVAHIMTINSAAIEFQLTPEKIKSLIYCKSLPSVPILYEMAEFFGVPMDAFFKEVTPNQ